MMLNVSWTQPGRALKMFNEERVNGLRKMLFSGNESERMISAGVLRTIFSDITRLFFENRQAMGLGLLVFNPESPEKSKYITKRDLENDLALAEEDCNEKFAEGFRKMIQVIEKEKDSDLALVAMAYEDGIAVNLIDPEKINETIDQRSNGLILWWHT